MKFNNAKIYNYDSYSQDFEDFVEEQIKTAIEVGNLGVTEGYMPDDDIIFALGFTPLEDGSYTPWAVIYPTKGCPSDMVGPLADYIEDDNSPQRDIYVTRLVNAMIACSKDYFDIELKAVFWAFDQHTLTFHPPQ